MLVTQSCLTFCDPMACSLPGSPVHGILQARILEWVAISFNLPDPVTETGSPALQANSLLSEPFFQTSSPLTLLLLTPASLYFLLFCLLIFFFFFLPLPPAYLCYLFSAFSRLPLGTVFTSCLYSDITLKVHTTNFSIWIPTVLYYSRTISFVSPI